MSNKHGKNQTKAILISGYAWSGSSAVLDLLKEFKNYSHFEPEFRLITDPGGLLDLEHALITSKSYTTINYALKRFKFLTKIYARNFHWWGNFKIYKAFQKIGFNYNKYMDLNFEQLSNSYIDDLIDLKYRGGLITSYYDLNRLSFFFLKVRFFIMRLFDKKKNKSEEIYFSNINKDSFIAKTREYTDKIIESIGRHNHSQHIVFDQAVQPSNAILGMQYFSNPKTIIVDRDPRDIYVQSHNLKIYSSIPTDNVDHFIKWYKLTRLASKSSLKSKDVLKIQFEDLILQYDETIKIICDFLGEEKLIHIDMKKHLNPENSKKNIGLWKDFENKKIIKKIHDELREYCWN